MLDRFKPDIVVCSFPAYANVLQEILGADRVCKCVVVVTDSITINASWYRSPADYFLVANEQSASVLRSGGVAPEKSGYLDFRSVRSLQISLKIGHCLPLIPIGGFVHDHCRQARRGRTRAYARET